jgi:hypothetical protein
MCKTNSKSTNGLASFSRTLDNKEDHLVKHAIGNADGEIRIQLSMETTEYGVFGR